MKNKIVLSVFLILVLSASGIWAGANQERQQENQQEEIIVPEGTVIPIIITAYLNTRSTQVGDTVYADTAYPIWIQQRLVIPKGSNIRGTITDVVRPGIIMGKGRLAVRFDNILLPNGVSRDFIASFRGIHSQGNEKIDRKTESVSSGSRSNPGEIGTVISTAGQGAIIGAVVDKGSGAIIGGGAGAAGGIVTMLMSRDRNLVLNPGTQFDLELKRPLKFAYNEVAFTTSQLNNAERENPTRPAGNNSRNIPRQSGIGGPGSFPGIEIPHLLF
jgi:hypothetical protein